MVEESAVEMAVLMVDKMVVVKDHWMVVWKVSMLELMKAGSKGKIEVAWKAASMVVLKVISLVDLLDLS